MVEKSHNSSSSEKYIRKMVKAIGDHCPTKLDYKRCGKKSSRRKMNMKRRRITFDEEILIIRLHSLLGNRWSLIAKRIPGRSDHEIESYWNSHHYERLNALSKHQRSAIKERELNRKIDLRDSTEVFEITKTRSNSSEVEDFGLYWIESELEEDDIGHNESRDCLVSAKEALLGQIYEEYEKLLN